MTTAESIHIYQNSRLQSESFTPEAVTAAYVAGLAALQEQAERENPAPLTTDELRQMDEQPVWCVSEGFSTWFIVQVGDEPLDESGDIPFWCYEPMGEILDCDSYGKDWLAYRYRIQGGDAT